MSERSAIRNRATLAALLGVGLLWRSFSPCIGGDRLLGSGLSSSSLPREDQHSATSRRLDQCEPGLSDAAKVDAQSRYCEDQEDQHHITLLTVYRSHVTTVGCFHSSSGSGDKSICLKDGKKGYLAMYLLGMVYTFVGLAIVCDEFFVPALETFVDELGISMDVAGATFMAAGGSMPELLTSFIATFDETEVGFAAIVGSAVFNVLFVIAVCAIASREVLELTWWPLARDCSFYMISVATVYVVFAIWTEGKIYWYEALILLAEYVGYCTFMHFNGAIYDWVASKGGKVSPALCEETVEASVLPEPCSSPTSRDVAQPRVSTVRSLEDRANLQFTKPSMFRRGIVQLLTQNSYLYETAGIAAVTQIKGTLDETFRNLDTDGNGFIDQCEVQELLKCMGSKHDSTAVGVALKRITRTGEGKIDYETFKRWYIASEARIEIEVRRVFDRFDKNSNGTIERDEIQCILRSLGHHPSQEEINTAIEDMVNSSADDVEVADSETTHSEEADCIRLTDPHGVDRSGSVSYKQFEKWYTKSLFWQGLHQQHLNEESAADSVGLSIEPPESPTCSALFWYIFTYPLCAILYCTLPDVRRPKWQGNTRLAAKVAVVEFLLSLCWIAFFSLCLYEWTLVCSNTIGIPPAVSAVTVLAAGTSIPDLLSSYVVARQGEGDMAVSSSIGSNIFDVTVGLPLPWLCFNIFRRRHVEIKSANIGISILVLLFMLTSVVVTVMVLRWRMTKTMGYVMLVLYVIFVAQDLLQQLPDGDPVLKLSL